MQTKEISDQGYHLLPPDRTMDELNRALLEASLSASQFTTAIYGVIDTEALTLRFARGGHPYPLWLRADGSTEEPETGGGLLGVIEGLDFELGTIQLARGDKFLLYSDGIESVFCPEGEKVSDDWRAEIERYRHLPVDEVVSRLDYEMDQQAGSLNPVDDITLLVLEVGEGPSD
jgi:sigma-B regulation protein RsbU (phosphoserine phosphatase)